MCFSCRILELLFSQHVIGSPSIEFNHYCHLIRLAAAEDSETYLFGAIYEAVVDISGGRTRDDLHQILTLPLAYM
jgi:hypothetical protein